VYRHPNLPVTHLVAAFALVAMTSWSATALGQTPDPRDYEVAYFVPSRTKIVNAYLRHQSGTHNTSFSADVLSLRLTYLLKFGDFAITPIDLVVPVINQRAYAAASSVLASADPAFAALPADFKLTLHAAGMGDIFALPTLGYGWTQDAEKHTHTWLALTTYVKGPTGKYDPDRRLNVGGNRWTFTPLLVLGQRMFRVLTLEAMASVMFATDNTAYRVSVPELAGADVTLVEQPTYTGALHAAVDLHPSFFLGGSYYFASNGRQDVEYAIPTAQGLYTDNPGTFVHTVRVNLGIRVTPRTILMAQWNEDVAGSESAELTRFFGLRVSHAFFNTPPQKPDPEP